MLVLLNALQAGNRSGTGRYVEELARRLPGLSDDVDLAVLWPEHVASHARAGTLLPRDAAGTARRLWIDQFGVRREQRRLRAGVVHYPANAGCLFNVHGMVVTVHDLSFLREPAWFRRERAVYYRFAVGRSARLATRLIADSMATALDLHELLGIETERIDVIPLGVGEEFRPAHPEELGAARAKHGLPERFFLYVGTLEPRKNIARLVEAWSRIADECECDLVLAGRDGWKAEPIWAKAAASPYADRIHFPGFVEEGDLPALLSAAHAFVWPSLYEGFGLPPLEAMACGTPVLTSNASSLPEIAGDIDGWGEAAVLVDPYDVDAIAAGMLDLAGNEALCESLRAKGLVRAAGFTWQKTAELTLKTYRTVA